jgi:hypothetical protein
VALPQHLTPNQGGTIFVDRRTRADNAFVSIYAGDGTKKVNPVAATISTVNTTLNTAVSRGGYQINVGSVTGIENAVKCWITDDPEELLIESRVGTVIALRRPLTRDHAAGAAVQGTRMSYTVPGANVPVPWFDGRCEWNVNENSTIFSAVECTKYPIYRAAAVQDLFDEDPTLYHHSPRESDWERALDKGLEEVLKRLGKSNPDARARIYPASREMVDATVYATIMIHYRQNPSEEAGILYERYRDTLNAEVDSIAAINPVDADQDGVVSVSDRSSGKTVKLVLG